MQRAPSPGTVSRNRFMIGVLSAVGGVIGVVYVGAILRYLYPQGGNDTPPLGVKLDASGATPAATPTNPNPQVNAWDKGVAGPFFYPTRPDGSTVVGVFIEQKVPNNQFVESNLRVVEQTCTHLGCPVNWVAADNRFECPCHGSQFRRDLSVYHGPAPKPLYEHEFTLKGDVLTILKRK